MQTKDLKVMYLDIETYKKMVLVGGYIPHEDRWVLFEISQRKNEMDAMCKFLHEETIDFYITYNGVLFDGQVLQYMLDNQEAWFDKTWEEICGLVYQFVQDLIDNQSYEIQPPYREQYMDIKQIDLFLLLHLNNQNRMTSLKWCEFSMDEDIEELPIHHGNDSITDDEIEQVISYWRNDIKATGTLYQWCLGNTEHESYKNKDKIQLRLDLIKEFGLPSIAVNWNDVKIGVELNKKNYLELTGMTSQKMWEKVKSKKSQKGFKFKDCYPKYTKFESKEFQEFFKVVGEYKVDLNNKQEFPFSYAGTNYTMAKGGGHSGEGARYIKPEEGYVLIDCDVSSMYPNIIRKHNIYPAHLGKEWNTVYVSNIPKRLDAKALYKKNKEKKYESFAEVFKYSLNGPFGKLIDKRDPTYDPLAGMTITIGGQVDIFMLAEDFELGGHHVVSMNTDGLTVMTKLENIQDYYRICTEWEKQVGNDEIGRLEYIEYGFLAQLSVNDYIALKTADWKEINGEFVRVEIDDPVEQRTKKKGDFLTDYEIYKNKSKRIVPLALEQWFINGTPVEQTIRNHKSLYDYGIAKKAGKDYYYKSIDRNTGQELIYNRLIRYYCAKAQKVDDKQEIVPGKLYKMKHEHSDKTGPKISQVESTSSHQIVFNKRVANNEWKELIDHEYYIQATKKLLHKIDPEMARTDKITASGALTLF